MTVVQTPESTRHPHPGLRRAMASLHPLQNQPPFAAPALQTLSTKTPDPNVAPASWRHPDQSRTSLPCASPWSASHKPKFYNKSFPAPPCSASGSLWCMLPLFATNTKPTCPSVGVLLEFPPLPGSKGGSGSFHIECGYATPVEEPQIQADVFHVNYSLDFSPAASSLIPRTSTCLCLWSRPSLFGFSGNTFWRP